MKMIFGCSDAGDVNSNPFEIPAKIKTNRNIPELVAKYARDNPAIMQDCFRFSDCLLFV
jgi:hypothetical protein